MLPAEFEPEAAAELEEAWLWYEEREPGLGDEFARAVKAVVCKGASHTADSLGRWAAFKFVEGT